MLDFERLFSRGPCLKCGERFRDKACYKGRCLPCRKPKDRRDLIRFGVPCGSANALALIMSKCNGDAEFVLEKVHPRLMENIIIVNRTLKIRDKRYRWIRRNGWVKAQ